MKDCRRYVTARKSLGLASNSPGQFLRPAAKGIQLNIIKKENTKGVIFCKLTIASRNNRPLVSLFFYFASKADSRRVLFILLRHTIVYVLYIST